MSNIQRAFTNGKAFIPFITCGDPDTATTKSVIHAAVENGADLIEIGIPFSDPTAEGPVIQEANIRALNGGITSTKVLGMVRELREEGVTIPLVFMTYANVVYSYGSDEFLRECEAVGVDGLILPDVPFEEKGEFSEVCKAHNVALISMIAPTSEQRIAMIAREAEGFIYVVSSLGVTGVRSEITTDLDAIVKAIRRVSDVPCAIGFGISTPEQAARMSKIADGVIVGSAIIKLLAKYGRESARYVGGYVKSMKDAIR